MQRNFARHWNGSRALPVYSGPIIRARVDVMNFPGVNPMAAMALTSKTSPVVRFVEISRMLERAMYRRIRLRFFRLHCQFISGNDRRAGI